MSIETSDAYVNGVRSGLITAIMWVNRNMINEDVGSPTYLALLVVHESLLLELKGMKK